MTRRDDPSRPAGLCAAGSLTGSPPHRVDPYRSFGSSDPSAPGVAASSLRAVSRQGSSGWTSPCRACRTRWPLSAAARDRQKETAARLSPELPPNRLRGDPLVNVQRDGVHFERGALGLAGPDELRIKMRIVLVPHFGRHFAIEALETCLRIVGSLRLVAVVLASPFDLRRRRPTGHRGTFLRMASIGKALRPRCRRFVGLAHYFS